MKACDYTSLAELVSYAADGHVEDLTAEQGKHLQRLIDDEKRKVKILVAHLVDQLNEAIYRVEDCRNNLRDTLERIKD